MCPQLPSAIPHHSYFCPLSPIGQAFLQKKEHGDMASTGQNLKGLGKEENNDCFS